MYKWFLAFRYMRTKLIALFGVGSVMFCVAMVLIVLSVMGGFLDTVRERARGLHSEIVLDGGTLQGFPYYAEFAEHVARELADIVDAATPGIYAFGVLSVRATNWTKPARILGVRLDDYVKVNDFAPGLFYNTYYPGTTHLGRQSMPVAGVDLSGRWQLPADLEQANQQWRASQTDPSEIAAYDAAPFEATMWPRETTQFTAERIFAGDAGPPQYRGPERYGIIVGGDLLFARNEQGNFDRFLARGADIALTLMPLSPTGNVFGEPPTKVLLRYADDSHTGIFEIDSLHVYVDFDMLQEKLTMGPQERADGGMSKPRANQVLIGLRDGVEINAARDRITDEWIAFSARLRPELTSREADAMRMARVYTWEDLQRAFINAVEKEKVLVTFLFGLISSVAIVLVGCIFYMIVEKKTRDIGILKSIGASGIGVGGLFIIYAATVGLMGAVLGTSLGTAVVWYINDIQDFLASIHPQLRVWSPDIYSFDKIPNVVKMADAIWVSSFAVVASVLGAVIPARIAGRVWPVIALRYE